MLTGKVQNAVSRDRQLLKAIKMVDFRAILWIGFRGWAAPSSLPRDPSRRLKRATRPQKRTTARSRPAPERRKSAGADQQPAPARRANHRHSARLSEAYAENSTAN